MTRKDPSIPLETIADLQARLRLAEERSKLMFSRFGTVRVPEGDLLALTKVMAFAFQKLGWNTIAQGCELDEAQMAQVSNVTEQLERRLKTMTEQGRQGALRSSAPLHAGASHG